jgi:hypothetical protein
MSSVRAARMLCTALAVFSAVSVAAELGVYRWDAPNGPANVDGFSQWLGRPVELAAAFEANDSWDNVDGADWQLRPWSQWVSLQPGRNLVLAVPMLPSSGATLAACSAGQYDVYWANLANNLSSYRLHWAYLRLGWEMDGGWYAWGAPQGSGKEGSYAGCFRRIVQVMRQTQPANQWKFVWNPTTAWWDPAYLATVWPGDEYVDIVGIDLYDQSWVAGTYPYPAGCDAACRLSAQQTAWNDHAWKLNTVRNFGLARGKSMAIPEWGVAIRPDGHGGGDTPYFIEKMFAYIQDPANYVVFHSYFGVSAGDIDARLTPSVTGDYPTGATRFPEASARYKQLFGPTNRAPQVSITAPATGQTVSGTVAYAASAGDDVGVSRVEFFVGANRVLSDLAAPYVGSLDTTTLANGTHTLKAVAYDAQGLSATSQVLITVRNGDGTAPSDATPPSVVLTSPAENTVVARRSTVSLAAAASDNVGVAAVEFTVNGQLVCRDTTAPYGCSWNTGGKPRQNYTITSTAIDAAGNRASHTHIFPGR